MWSIRHRGVKQHKQNEEAPRYSSEGEEERGAGHLTCMRGLSLHSETRSSHDVGDGVRDNHCGSVLDVLLTV